MENKTKQKDDDKDWLKDAIVDYIKNYNSNRRLTSEVIVHHFHLRVDITFIALRELVKAGRVKKIDYIMGGYNGNHRYEV